MEIQKTSKLPEILRDKFKDQQVKVTFTQWEDDRPEDDETTTTFIGTIVETAVSENQFSGLDGAFHFQTEEDEIIEILMDFPPDDEDVIAVVDGNIIRIYGNEAELLLHSVH